MNIPRLVQQQIVAKIGAQKVLVLYGTRRTGKTTIIEDVVNFRIFSSSLQVARHLSWQIV